MAFQHQGLEDPSEAASQQSTCAQVYYKNNQHTAQCVFNERASEPSPKRHLKHVLMEWCIHRVKRHGLPSTWDCPLPSCDEQCSSFPAVMSHLEGCQYLKTNTRQYTCPDCQKDVRMPGRGQGEKAISKIRRSLESVLHVGRPSSPARSSSTASSPVSPLSFDAGPSQATYPVSPLSFSCGNTGVNPHATNPFSQQNRIFAVDPIVTQFNSTSTYAGGPYTNSSCPSSTTTSSSCEGDPCSAFSSQGIPSAVSLSTQPTWSPSSASAAWIQTPTVDSPILSSWPNMPQPAGSPPHVGDLSRVLTLPELSEQNYLQGTTDTEGIEAFFAGDSDINITGSYSDVELQYQDELTSFLHKWSQREGFSSFMPEPAINSPEGHGAALEVAGSTYPVHDPFSPVPSDVTMVDSPATGGDSPPAADSSIPECKICRWKPDTSVKRSVKRLAAAVEKHVTRNHRSKNFQCPICDQVFRNRPDNVKPHVVRKHPEMVASLYPVRAVQDGPPQHEKASSALARAAPRRRRASMPLPASQASPAHRKLVRLQQGFRG